MSTENIDWNMGYKNERDYKWLPTSRLTHILDRIDIPKGAQVLDIGCGTGQLCRDLVHRGFKVKGVDRSNAAIHQAQQSTMLPNEVIEFAVCDVEKDDIDVDDRFDVIFCKYVLPFITDKDRFLQKIAALKAKNGYFIVISPDIASLPGAKQHIAIKHTELIEMLSVYFDNVTSECIDGDFYYYVQ